MPIGKNSIKRVLNNGYSSVKASAPDMENSVVIEEKTEAQTAPQKTVPEKKPTPKAEPKAEPKAATNASAKQASKAEPKAQAQRSDAKKKAPAKKPAPKKSMESEPTFSPVNTAVAVVGEKTDAGTRCGEGYVNLGGKLPYYLL